MGQWRIRASESSNSEEKHSNRKKGARGLLWKESEGVAEQNVFGDIFYTQWRNKMLGAISLYPVAE